MHTSCLPGQHCFACASLLLFASWLHMHGGTHFTNLHVACANTHSFNGMASAPL